MVYNITLTNGLALTTIADYTQDNTTSLTLLGRGVANYGQVIANDLVHLMENFSAATAPPNPLTGQLWYNSATKNLESYDGTLWHQLVTLDELSSLGFLSGNEEITLTGDVTGSGTTSIVTTIKSIPGLAAGTYEKVTVNSKGQVTAGTNLTSADITTAAGSTLTVNGTVDATSLVLTSQGGGSIKFPDGTTQTTAATAAASAVSSLGFTPVQQGTGIGQQNNTIKIGWSSTGQLLLTVDSTNEGAIALQSYVTSSIATAVSTAESVAQTYANTAQTNAVASATSLASAAQSAAEAYAAANYVSKDLSTNNIYLGWSASGNTLIAQVDSTYLGGIALQSWVESSITSGYLGSTGNLAVDGSGTIVGNLTVDGLINSGNATINGSQVNYQAQWQINGSYLVMASGYIIQYGIITAPTGGGVYVGTFPIQFPHTVFTIVGSFGSSVPPSTGAAGISLANTAQFTFSDTGPAGGGNGIYYIAIGY